MTPAQQNAVAHYLGKGLSKDAACGIVAVLTAESNLNPGSQGVQSTETPGVLNPSGAFAAMSLNGIRQNDFKIYMDEYHAAEVQAAGGSYALLLPQLDWVLTEAAGFSKGSNPKGCPTFWAAITSPASHYSDVVNVMVRDYEVPKDPAGEIARAMPIAASLMESYTAPAPQPTPTPAPAPVAPTPLPPAPTVPALSTREIELVAQITAAVMGVLQQNGVSL